MYVPRCRFMSPVADLCIVPEGTSQTASQVGGSESLFGKVQKNVTTVERAQTHLRVLFLMCFSA